MNNQMLHTLTEECMQKVFSEEYPPVIMIETLAALCKIQSEMLILHDRELRKIRERMNTMRTYY